MVFLREAVVLICCCGRSALTYMETQGAGKCCGQFAGDHPFGGVRDSAGIKAGVTWEFGHSKWGDQGVREADELGEGKTKN
jgi:hypothetical protein